MPPQSNLMAQFGRVASMAEQVRCTHARLTHALNRNEGGEVGACLARNAVVTHQLKGGRPEKMRGMPEIASFLAKERAAWADAGIEEVRYSFPDAQVEMMPGQLGMFRVTSQYMVYSVPAGGLYGGIIECGEVEDVYEFEQRMEGFKLSSRHIRSDKPAPPPTAASA
eukprot:TRINITY_DN17041_c0_g1_i1.p1 TRINITY_DN17041_c0_g1~~TRINITY_DN17041_c0_g1_i1.p1  ORF type:complete len:186 (+),score=58.13 TRINITY_DN17041_c0_g1_i1:58-558(+)